MPRHDTLAHVQHVQQLVARSMGGFFCWAVSFRSTSQLAKLLNMLVAGAVQIAARALEGGAPAPPRDRDPESPAAPQHPAAIRLLLRRGRLTGLYGAAPRAVRNMLLAHG